MKLRPDISIAAKAQRQCMIARKRLRFLKWIVVVILFAPAHFAQGPSNSPRVFLLNAQKLAETKQRIQSGEKSFALPLTKLESDAAKALQQEPLSLVPKTPTPPTTHNHDHILPSPS